LKKALARNRASFRFDARKANINELIPNPASGGGDARLIFAFQFLCIIGFRPAGGE